jgi:uncharacterized membrane protein YwzB
MTLAWHRRLMLIESIVITMPMFVIICWFGALSFTFGLTIATTTSAIAGIGFIAVAIVGIAGMAANFHLSFLYLSRGLDALQQSGRRYWVVATIGAALALMAILSYGLFREFGFAFHSRTPDFAVGVMYAWIGTPLLIPYIHLLYLRGLLRADEAKT